MRKFFVILLIASATIYGCIAVRPTERINFTAPDSYPEGVAFDPAQKVYYVSSARTGTIGRVTPEGTYSMLHADSALRSTYGMKLHPDGKRLYACVSDANYSRYTSPETRKKLARLIGIDVSTGQKVADIDLSGLYDGERFANDLVFDNKGNIYLTDSYSNVIVKVDGANKPSVFSKSDSFQTAGVGLNGIVYHPGGYLLVNSTGKGSIFKIDINNPANVKQVRTSMNFIGADGMLLNDEQNLTMLVNGGNDKIFKLQSKDGWQSAQLVATTLIADRYSYPATATFAGDDIWVMNAKFHELNDSNAIPSKTFAIQKLVLKPVPKKFSEIKE